MSLLVSLAVLIAAAFLLVAWLVGLFIRCATGPPRSTAATGRAPSMDAPVRCDDAATPAPGG